MSEMYQSELFEPTVEQKFEAWKQTAGGGHVLRDIYAMAAPYARAYKREGVKVSVKLLWEMERHRIKRVRSRAQRLGVRVGKVQGYTLNNNFTALVARHIESRRPDWAGMFERRERNRDGGRKLAVVLPMDTRKSAVM